MNNALKLTSYAGLVVTLVMPFSYFYGNLNLDQMKMGLTIAMFLWFVPAWFWMKKPE